MKIPRILGFTSAALVVAISAQADWQYTHWGMTPDEIVAASGGKATRLEPTETNGMEAAAAPYEIGDLHFKVSFAVDRVDHTLNRIDLRLVSDDQFSAAVKIKQALIEKYGKPGKEEGSFTENISTSRGLAMHSHSVEWWTDKDHITFHFFETDFDIEMKAKAQALGRPIPPPTQRTTIIYQSLRSKERDAF